MLKVQKCIQGKHTEESNVLQICHIIVKRIRKFFPPEGKVSHKTIRYDSISIGKRTQSFEI